MHNLPNRERYLASCLHRAKLTAPVAIGVARQSSFSLNLVCPGSVAIFAREAGVRRLRARPSPSSPTRKETGALATQYFSRPQLQIFRLFPPEFLCQIGLSDPS